MVTDGENCKVGMKRMLKVLVDAKKVDANKCDDILRQFGEFIDSTVAASPSDFKDFQLSDRVDVLLHRSMASNASYSDIWPVCRRLLLLSHDQASVERGFSINKELEVENLRHVSLISQRLIVDHIHSVGGVLNVEITKELIYFASGARQRYMAHLKEDKKRKVVSEKRKSDMDLITELKQKKRRLEIDIDSLTKSADEYADKAESTGHLTWITKSNSMRRTAKEKRSELSVVQHRIDECVKASK